MNARLYLSVVVIEAKRLLQYRADFWLGVVAGFLAGVLIPFFFWTSIYRANDGESASAAPTEFAGYSLGAIVAYSIAAALTARFVRASDLPAPVATEIYEGGLNRYLVFPVSYGPLKFAQHIGGLSSVIIQFFGFGGLLLWLMPIPEEVGITVTTVLWTIPLLLLANLLYFLIVWPLQLVAFWADNIWSLIILARFITGILGGAMLPLALFPETFRDIVAWTPFPLLFERPVKALLGWRTPAEMSTDLALGAVWAVVLALIGMAVWKLGRRRYSGVGI